ncbi:hypothetical protein CLM62_12100 [Streptomyces sp. SA15]|nr:hypothetical protein CLM62_12100 [Streptomyces sp. SA15]
MSRPIDTTALFSDPEPTPLRATTESPPPHRNPFQAPAVKEDTEDTSPATTASAPATVPGTRKQPRGRHTS